MTDHGKAQVLANANILVGPGKLIDPSKIAKIYVSPQIRAVSTADLIFGESLIKIKESGKYDITNALSEMVYGDYGTSAIPAWCASC